MFVFFYCFQLIKGFYNIYEDVKITHEIHNLERETCCKTIFGADGLSEVCFDVL